MSEVGNTHPSQLAMPTLTLVADPSNPSTSLMSFAKLEHALSDSAASCPLLNADGTHGAFGMCYASTQSGLFAV